MTRFLTDPYNQHISAVATITAAGITPPPAWTELRDRWEEQANNHGPSAVDRYATALVTGNPKADLATLRALALAEAASTTQHQATVANAAKARVVRKLLDLYTPVALDNYTVIAAQFDKAAAEFIKCASTVDPEADPATLVSASDSIRKGWIDALLTARQLDALIPVLTAAADLAGVRIASPEATLALTVDPTGLHRRRVWEAWESAGRCGRWSALVALGATIRAHDLQQFTTYRKPRPVEERWEQISRGMSRPVMVDPEDQELADQSA